MKNNNDNNLLWIIYLQLEKHSYYTVFPVQYTFVEWEPVDSFHMYAAF